MAIKAIFRPPGFAGTHVLAGRDQNIKGYFRRRFQLTVHKPVSSALQGESQRSGGAVIEEYEHQR